MSGRLRPNAHRQQQVVDLLEQAHSAGRPGVPLNELRQRLNLRGWQVLDRLTWRGLIWVGDGIVFLQARRPLLPVRLPPNVIRLRRPAPLPPHPQPWPGLPPAA